MKNIDELYKNILQNAETTPPDNLWSKLSAKLSVEAAATANVDGSLSHTISSSANGAIKATAKIATWKTATIATLAGASITTATIVSLNDDTNQDVYQHATDKTIEIVAPAYIDTVSVDVVSVSTPSNNTAHETTNSMVDNTVAMSQPSEQQPVDIDNAAITTPDTGNSSVKQTSCDSTSTIVDNNNVDTIVPALNHEESTSQEPILENNDMMSLDSLKRKLQEMKESVNIIIPNIITPNYDNHNDCWKISGIENYYNVHVVIATRTGLIIYENRRYDNSWCPTDIPDGTYFYAITIISHNYHKKGVLEIRSK